MLPTFMQVKTKVIYAGKNKGILNFRPKVDGIITGLPHTEIPVKMIVKGILILL